MKEIRRAEEHAADVRETEIMVFTIDGHLFGVDIGRVQEIMKVESLVAIQKSNEYIEGVFKPRDKVVTVINLPAYLGLKPSEKPERDIFIIISINDSLYAFHVHTVVGIQAVVDSELKKPDPVIFGGKEGIATGIAQLDGKLVTIIGFESVIEDICKVKELDEEALEAAVSAI